MGLFEKYNEKWKEANSPNSKYERMKATAANQKARNEFKKYVDKQNFSEKLTEKQEAILFSQVYELPRLKNPAAAKFPEFSEYTVEEKESVYKVIGYVDSTNSYGAQVRSKYEFDLMKVDGEWTCIQDGSGRILVYGLIIALIIFAPAIFAYCSLIK